MSRLAAELPRCMAAVLGLGRCATMRRRARAGQTREAGSHGAFGRHRFCPRGCDHRSQNGGQLLDSPWRAPSARRRSTGYQQACPQPPSLTHKFGWRRLGQLLMCDALHERLGAGTAMLNLGDELPLGGNLDMERIIIDPDYRRLVLANLLADLLLAQAATFRPPS